MTFEVEDRMKDMVFGDDMDKHFYMRELKNKIRREWGMKE